MRVLKHFDPWDTFLSEGIETFFNGNLSDFFGQNS